MSHSVGLRERGMASPQIYSQAPGRGLRISRNLRTALFLAPAALVVIVMVIAPIIQNFVISLTDMGADLRVTRFSFDQYARMALLDTRIKSAAVLSLIVTVSVVSLNIMLALALSVTTTMVGQRTGAIYRTIWLLPRISPVVVYAMLWKLALSPTEQGGVNAILARIGVAPIAPLNDHALLVVILAGVGIGASLGMVLFTSTIRSIDQHLFYAASADGAGRFAQIRHVVLPALRRQIAFLSAFQFLSVLTGIELILLITHGGPFYDTTVYPLYAASRAFSTGQYAYGAALATGLVVVGIFLSLILFRLQRGQASLDRPRIEIG